MKATEGNGGEPIVLHKGKVEKPEICRGLLMISPQPDDLAHEDGSITFIHKQPGFDVTYHRVFIASTDCDTRMIMDVRAETVVTWTPKA